MNRKGDLISLGDLYEFKYITEALDKIPTDTFPQAKDKTVKLAKAKSNAFVQKDSGPAQADGYSADIVDPKNKKYKKDAEVTKFSQKNESAGLNTFMSKKFDDLFNDVMSDRLQLEDHGVDTVEDVTSLPELDVDVDVDDVTVEDEDLTPSEMLDKVVELLGKIRDSLGEDESGEDVDDDVSLDVDASEDDVDLDLDVDDEVAHGEETEMKEVKDSQGEKLTGKNNKVGGVAGKVATGKAQNVSDYKVSANDGEPPKGVDLAGKNNKVSSTVTAGKQVGH